MGTTKPKATKPVTRTVKPTKPKEGRQGKGVTTGTRYRRPKLNALQRHQRGRTIAAMRSRHPRPVAWKDISRHLGIAESTAHDCYEQYLAAEESMIADPLEAVNETIDVMTVAMHQALITYEAAPPGTSVRVQALRTAVDTALMRLQVMRSAGRAPRSLAAPAVAQQLQLVLREFAELLRRHDVGDQVLRDFLDLADSQMGRMTAIEGRELPPAAAAA